MIYQNPILPGFNPDPSIFADGEDYYLATSSFEFFPGVPLYHSKNLINWELIGYVLDRESQLPLGECRASRGIYAPTIRKHGGVWYMITTNVTWQKERRANLIVHADNPAGPWSEPVYIDHEGIDPSLFFDDDGSCWYTGTDVSGPEQGIVLFRVDPMTGAILSDKKIISYGWSHYCPEAPHLYKINGWYYLIIAEGGTEYGHMAVVGRSHHIDGPYDWRRDNPLVSNRDSKVNPIKGIGHADIMQDANGNWWAVSLGFRTKHAQLHHLGRETFLTPITWNGGWPYAADGGEVSLQMDAPLPKPETITQVNDDKVFDFTALDKLPLDFNFMRNPYPENYRLAGDGLHLTGTDVGISSMYGRPTWCGFRQTQADIHAEMTLGTDIAEGTMAGLTAFMMHSHHYEAGLCRQGGQLYAFLRKKLYDMETVKTFALPDAPTDVTVVIDADFNEYRFALKCGEKTITLGTGMTAGLCTEVTEHMTFTGLYLSAFAENGEAVVKKMEYHVVKGFADDAPRHTW